MATETTGLEWEVCKLKAQWQGRDVTVERHRDIKTNRTMYHWSIFGVNGGNEPTLEAAKAAVERIVGQDQPGGAG